MNLNKDISFSKKIEDKALKEQICSNIEKPKDIGVMIRTNAASVSVETINEEINKLYSIYKEICSKEKFSVKPGILFNAGGIFGRVLRDRISGFNCKIYSDSKEDYDYIKDFSSDITDAKINIKLHEEIRSIFNYYNIEREILSLRNDKVSLNCGGYIVIDKTEAMYVVDVNSGKNVKNTSIEKTAFVTNYQAAEEIVRQVRLRNLSGIIVIDFIDMDNEENRQKIMDTLNQGFADDKNKTVIYPFTELNLVQIARRRFGKSIYEYIEEDCGTCLGKGKRIKFSYICMLIKNEILRINEQRKINDIHIEIDESYKNDIKGDILSFVKNIDALDKKVYVTYKKEEHFKVEALIFMNQIENLQISKIYG
jgi:ribonuclease G